MKGKCMKLVMSLADYDLSVWKLLPIIYHHSYSTFNVALKARNKAVQEDTIAATDVDTDYSKPRSRKPSKRLLSSDSESDEEPRGKKLVRGYSIPEPSSTLPSNLKKLLDSTKAKNSAKSKQKCSAISKLLSTSLKKDTTPICQLLQEESARSETTNDERAMMIEPPEIVKKTYTCEQSPDSHDVNTLKSDHNNYLRMNKKTSTLDRCTSSKSSLEDSQPSTVCKSCGSTNNKLQEQVILNYIQELSAKIDWQNIGISQILHELFPDTDCFDRPEGFPSLPLETEESFAGFDCYLDNKIFYGHMLKYLLRKGKGETTSLFTYSILSTLLRNNLARLISWKGSGGVKLSFEKSKLKNLVEAVCLKKFSNVQISVFEDHMKRWLNTSMQRSD